jgi:hypothetical protein
MKYTVSGYSSDIFVNLFDALPLPLSTMVGALFSLPTTQDSSRFSTPSSVPPQTRIALENASAHFASDAALWDSEKLYGFFEVWFDPLTAQRQQLFMNSRFAQIYGFHKEELMARFANYDADLQRTEIDVLLLTLDGIQNILDDSKSATVERYYRMFSGPSRQPILLWTLWGKGFINEGTTFKVRSGAPSRVQHPRRRAAHRHCASPPWPRESVCLCVS